MEVVDIAFALKGGAVPADHGWQLYGQLAGHLKWLEAEENAGVHPIRGARAGGEMLYVGGRGRLMLRLPYARAEEAFSLSGARLELGDGVEIGAARLRELFAHGTLYSPFVFIDGTDGELAFQMAVRETLNKAGMTCKVVLGKARHAHGEKGTIEGFSVMLHDLSPEQSLLLQQTGLGGARKLGCGIFTPHRSAAAVAS